MKMRTMRPVGRLRTLACCGLVLGLMATGTSVSAQSAEQLYRDAQTREDALRASAEVIPAEYRSIIRAYEDLVRRYPRSGYSDNAFWQAAGLARDLFERTDNPRDRDHALRFLRLIVSEYPSSSLVPGAILEVSRLSERAIEVRRAAAAPPTRPPPPPGSPVTIRRISRVVLPEVVRVVIELDAEVSYHHERIENPTRIFVDLENTYPSPAVRSAVLRYDEDIVRQVRLGTHPPDTTRVVLDVDNLARYSFFTLYEPFRVVIDAERLAPGTLLADLEEDAAAPDEAPAAPSPNATGRFSMARQLGLGASRIVIDPGHGGRDPGATQNGVTEAELVLDIALRLEKLLLEGPATEVVLTRRTDAYVALEERTAIANRQHADLFLSIHANASGNAKTRGIETYFLNFTTNPEAESVAARENAASGRTITNLPGLIRAITLNNKRAESEEFAGLVQGALVERLNTDGMQNLGVKQAPFVVLIGAEMPSILAEVAFITNRQDQVLLKDSDYRQRIAEALLTGVLEYRSTLKTTHDQIAKQ